MIDRHLVQQIIETNISEDFEIGEVHDAGPYIIIFWKHKKYNTDDERGRIVGPGPVIYFKEEAKYKLIGSGDWFYGEYANYLPPELFAESERKHNIVMELLEDNYEHVNAIPELIDGIKTGILRRNYVNNDDIDCLSILYGARRLYAPFDIKSHPDFNREEHAMIVSNNKEALAKLRAFWEEIEFGFQVISDTELVLLKVRK